MAQANEEQLAKLVGMQEAAMAKLTKEQNDENKAKFAAMMADEAQMAEFMEMDKATFQAADADQDGKLNKAEFVDFSKKQEANGKAQGWHVADSTDAEIDEWWAAMTEITGDATGLKKEDYDALQGQMMQAFAEKMGE